MKTKNKMVQLYSGGMDSYILSKLYNPDVKVYFDLGTLQSEKEKERLPKDVVIKRLPLSDYVLNDGHETIMLRNLIISALAVNYGETILLGSLSTDKHYDDKPKFRKIAGKLFNYVLRNESKAFGKELKHYKIISPNCSKSRLVEQYLRKGGTLEDLETNSWSCYNPTEDGIPCGCCSACMSRQKAIEDALNRIESTKHYLSSY